MKSAKSTTTLRNQNFNFPVLFQISGAFDIGQKKNIQGQGFQNTFANELLINSTIWTKLTTLSISGFCFAQHLVFLLLSICTETAESLMKKINSYQLYDMFSKKINFSLFYVKVIVFVLLKGFIYDSKIIIILSIYSRLFVENRLMMIAVLFFLFRIQQHLRCALILYLSSSTRLTTHSLSFFPIFKHMGQEVGLSFARNIRAAAS